MGVDRGASDFWRFGRSRIEILSEDEAAEVRRRTVPRPPFGMPERRREDQPTEMWLNTEIPGKGMSLTEAVEQIRRKPRSERLSGELNTPELRKRDAEKREDEFLDTVPGLDPRCRAKWD